MCGIAAIISVNPEKTVDPVSIRKMASAISHRGPDDEGYFIRPNVALGHKRLSIIDVEGGKQPMSTPDKRYTIVFNGEIFNYKQHRAHLEMKGATFRTQSDTEVVMVGYQKYGNHFFDRLEGMFAGVIFDALENRVVVFRDAFGIKPLYVCKEDDFFFICSEIKGIAKVKASAFSMNEKSLYSYFMLGYVPGKQTLVRSVERVSPGNVLEIQADGQVFEVAFSSRLSPKYLAVPREMSEKRLHEELILSVERSMVSDVPVGLYLSGGVDSSLLAAIAKKELQKDLPSYCVSFSNQASFDESSHAKKVARDLGIPFQSIELDPNSFQDIDRLAQVLEEPMLDPSAMALHQLARAVKPSMKVVLSGDGGDELFGGYNRYFWDTFLDHYAELPTTIQRITESTLAILGLKGRRLQKMIDTKNLPRDRRYFSWFSAYSRSEMETVASLVDKAFFSRFCENLFEHSKNMDPVAQLQWIDMVTFLRDGLLAKSDKTSMSSSVEVRVPFLQTNLVEAAFALPRQGRVGMFQTKGALRNILKKYLPAQTVERKKQGFEFPLDEWFRTSWKGLLQTHLSEEVVAARPWFSKPMVDRIKKEHADGKQNRGRALFSMVMLEAWTRKFLDH